MTDPILKPDDLDAVPPDDPKSWRGEPAVDPDELRACAGCGLAIEPDNPSRFCLPCQKAVEH